MRGWDVDVTVLAFFSFIVGFVGIIVLIMYGQAPLQTECWRDTLTEVRPVTGAFELETLGLGKLLGKGTFSIALSMKSSCVDRIIFDDLSSCVSTCAGTDRFDPDENKCVRECGYCRGSKGCITVVPTGGKLSDFLSDGPLNYFRKRSQNLAAFNAPDYRFEPAVFISPEEGVEIHCLTFTKRGADAYKITSETVSTTRDCRVTGLGLT